MDLNSTELRLVHACAGTVTERFLGDNSKGNTASLASACLTSIQLAWVPPRNGKRLLSRVLLVPLGGTGPAPRCKREPCWWTGGIEEERDLKSLLPQVAPCCCPHDPHPLVQAEVKSTTQDPYLELLAWCEGMSRNKTKVFIYLLGMEEESINAIYLAVAMFLKFLLSVNHASSKD